MAALSLVLLPEGRWMPSIPGAASEAVAAPPPTDEPDAGIVRPNLVIQNGSNTYVNAILSEDESLLLTGDGERVSRLWDAKTGALIRQVDGCGDLVCLAPNGNYAFGCDRAGRGVIWDTRTGVIRLKTDFVATSAKFSPDSSRLAAGGWDSSVWVWDVAGGGRTNVLAPSKRRGAFSLEFSPDGKKLAIGHEDGTIVLWSVENQNVALDYKAHEGLVWDLAFSPDGGSLFSGGTDDVVRRHNLTKNELEYQQHLKFEIMALAVSQDRKLLFAGSRYGGTIHVIDAIEGKPLRTISLPVDGVTSLSFCHNGRDLLCGEAVTDIRRKVVTGLYRNISPDINSGAWLVDPVTGVTRQFFGGIVDPVEDLAISEDGRYLAASSPSYRSNGNRQSVFLWDLNRGARVWGHAGLPGWRSNGQLLSCASDGVHYASDRSIIKLDINDGRISSEITRFDTIPVENATKSEYASSYFVLSRAASYVVHDGVTARLPAQHGAVQAACLSADGKVLATVHQDRERQVQRVHVWNARDLTEIASVGEFKPDIDGDQIIGRVVSYLDINPAAGKVAVGCITGQISVFDYLRREGRDWSNEGHGLNSGVRKLVFSPDGSRVGVAFRNSALIILDARDGREVSSPLHDSTDVTSIIFSRDGKHLITCSRNNAVQFWDVASGAERLRVLHLSDSNWVVIEPGSGRFDTNNLESVKGVHWVFPDDPYRPLQLEIFMRDYYEPRLLPRILSGEVMAPVRPLSKLNRVVPRVELAEVNQGPSAAESSITVRVASARDSFKLGGKEVVFQSGVYDLRLFCNGRLVGRWPEPADVEGADPAPTSNEQMAAWRETNRISPGPDGAATRTFTVRLPHRAEPGPVEFTAYAFNEDRVKSETARATYQAPASALAGRPRAYLVCLGVGATEGRGWDLAFAAADARLVIESLGGALARAGKYDVVPVLLTSERGGDRTVGETTATKANLRAALDVLAGREVDDRSRARLPRGERLHRATPDDLVILSFSGHGYTDRQGSLYLLPYDVGEGQQRVEDVLDRCISTGELSAWLSAVDAGEITMVVDACHSAAAVQQPGFKPGPFGSRGLGQLAYDKGMRVLAASQADDVAVESASIRHGMLTYALVKDGLEQRRAAKNAVVTLGGLLAYAAERVPGLYKEVLAGGVRDASGAAARNVGAVRLGPERASIVQRPELFDYARGGTSVILGRQP